MTVMAHEPQTQESYLLEGFLALDAPEGFRAELIDGEIVVTPPPGGDHDRNVALTIRQIVRDCTVRFDFWPNKGLVVPASGGVPGGRVIPDCTFAPAELALYRNSEPWSPPDGVAMVLEVTSSRPDRDRVAKRHCYAQADIPLYLLLDREKQTATLFSSPENRDYHKVVWVPFGKAIELPEPFGIELDTAEFV